MKLVPICQLLGKRQAPGPVLPEEEPVVRVDHLTWAGKGGPLPTVGNREEQMLLCVQAPSPQQTVGGPGDEGRTPGWSRAARWWVLPWSKLLGPSAS